MAYIPYSQQIGAVYTLFGPSGARAQFNNSADVDNIGTLSEVTGLDSPEIREAADDLASADGGQHGQFWYGRRNITMKGMVHGHTTMEERDLRLDKLRRATDAMRSDTVLTIQNLPLASNPVLMTWVRRQARLQFSGNWVKEFQVALVSEFAPIFNNTAKDTGTGAGPFVCENQGNYPSNPTLTLVGGTSATEIVNEADLTVIRLAAGLPAGATLVINTQEHTATLNGAAGNQYINYTTTRWPAVNPGLNTYKLQLGPGTLRVQWRDSWV